MRVSLSLPRESCMAVLGKMRLWSIPFTNHPVYTPCSPNGGKGYALPKTDTLTFERCKSYQDYCRQLIWLFTELTFVGLIANFGPDAPTFLLTFGFFNVNRRPDGWMVLRAESELRHAIGSDPAVNDPNLIMRFKLGWYWDRWDRLFMVVTRWSLRGDVWYVSLMQSSGTFNCGCAVVPVFANIQRARNVTDIQLTVLGICKFHSRFFVHTFFENQLSHFWFDAGLVTLKKESTEGSRNAELSRRWPANHCSAKPQWFMLPEEHRILSDCGRSTSDAAWRHSCHGSLAPRSAFSSWISFCIAPKHHTQMYVIVVLYISIPNNSTRLWIAGTCPCVVVFGMEWWQELVVMSDIPSAKELHGAHLFSLPSRFVRTWIAPW